MVFDDEHNDRKSGDKLKQQKGRRYSDEDSSMPRTERDRKTRHSDDEEGYKRERRQGGKERDRRRERKESHSSENSPRDRKKRGKWERSPSISDDDDNDERIKKKKKRRDDYSRSHKVRQNECSRVP